MLRPCNEKCYFASFGYGFGCAIWQDGMSGADVQISLI